MEYKILRSLRFTQKLPFIIRLFFGVFFILISSIPIILPLFPGSLLIGIFILVVGTLLVVSPNKIRHVIKMRKSIVYLFMNLHSKKIIKHKIYDIKTHVKDIIRNEDEVFKKEVKIHIGEILENNVIKTKPKA
ncbi:MAG: hypothetical protein PHV23_02625 [Candidatus Gracilibacteria bacterium]|nr:hypothetical protein [Candidatus Gracilibacteria bacterium]